MVRFRLSACLNDAKEREEGVEGDGGEGHGLRRFRERLDGDIIRSEDDA